MTMLLVLEDYSDGQRTLRAGSTIDSGLFDVPKLQSAGLAVVPYTLAMEPWRLAFLAQRGSRPVAPLTPDGDLPSLLIAAGIIGGGGGGSAPVSPVVTSGPYTTNSCREFVRVAPDGSLVPIVITIGDPTMCPGQTTLVKKQNTEIATLVEVKAGDGSLIDGAASSPLPATPYAVLRFTSDGTNWSVT